MSDFETVFSVDNLVATRDQLTKILEESRDEMARLRASVSVIEERLQLVSRLIEVEERVESEEAPRSPGQRFEWAAPPQVSSPRGSDDQLETEVERILEVAARPMHIGEIRSELIQKGFPIPGRGDDANIIVRLRKDSTRFVRTARGTYGLPKWGLPSIDRPKSSKAKGRR